MPIHWKALFEAAFLTGVERNADVVVLASYAPLFARVGYAQWSPDMIWFDDVTSYGTPSYYVQQMYAQNCGTITIDMEGQEKEWIASGVYINLSLLEGEEGTEVIVKAVNCNKESVRVPLLWGEKRKAAGQCPRLTVLSGTEKDSFNSIDAPDTILPRHMEQEDTDGLTLEGYSFTVARIPVEEER